MEDLDKIASNNVINNTSFHEINKQKSGLEDSAIEGANVNNNPTEIELPFSFKVALWDIIIIFIPLGLLFILDQLVFSINFIFYKT